MRRGVTVVGSANLDLVLRVRRIPAPGETVLATDHQRHPGGKGLNQAVAAARAGARTAFVGTLGTDGAGDLLLAAMSHDAIDVEAVTRVESAPSGTALIVVQDSGENTIVVAAGANAASTALSVAGREAIGSAAVLLAQLEVPVSVVAEAVACARDAGTTVVLNASPVTTLPDGLLQVVDVLVVNEHEAVALVGGGLGPVAAAAALAARGCEVVVTLGERGAVHVDATGRLDEVPGVRAEVRDSTGAGDTFAGVLAAALADGSSIGTACRRAVVAGALAVETDGAVPSIPTRAAVDERLAARP